MPCTQGRAMAYATLPWYAWQWNLQLDLVLGALCVMHCIVDV